MCCAHSLFSPLGVWGRPFYMCPCTRMSLLKSPTTMTLCVCWWFVRMLIWSIIYGMRWMSFWCGGIYKSSLSSGEIGCCLYSWLVDMTILNLVWEVWWHCHKSVYLCGSWLVLFSWGGGVVGVNCLFLLGVVSFVSL